MNMQQQPLPNADQNDEHINNAIDDLRSGTRMHTPPVDAAKTAAQLHALTSDDTLSSEIDHKTEHMILQRFAKKEHAHEQMHNFVEEKSTLWKRLSLGFAAPILAMGLAVVAYVVVQDVRVQTVAEVQGVESLSPAEEILGRLPVETRIAGIDPSTLRAEIHAINLQEQQTNTQLDPNAATFPHVELRDSALEIIAKEKKILDRVETAPVEIAFVETDLSSFEQAVGTWPTQNEGVDFETHKKAVDTFLKHNQTWNSEIEQIIQEILKKQLKQ